MFNKELYPTPNSVIEAMCFGFDFSYKNVLEPSAGKANILKYIKSKYDGVKLFYCEIEPELSKFCSPYANFMADDFLTLKKEDVSHIDYFVMNPPFSADDTHILHTWNIAKDGAVIISLCNSNTINDYRRAYYKDAQSLERIIDFYGHIKRLGNVFSNAERHTDVNVSLAVLTKPITNEESYFDLNEFETQDFDDFDGEDGVKTYNYIEAVVNAYRATAKELEKQAEIAVNISKLVKPFDVRMPDLAFVIKEEDKEVTIETILVKLRINFWQKIFEKMNMRKFETAALRAQINEFFKTQQQIPFTMKNIYKMIEMVLGTHSGRMDKALVEAFDLITSKSAENKHSWGETWKTNIPDGLAKKFILNYVSFPNSWSGRIDISGSNADAFDDFHKAVMYHLGSDLNNHKTLRSFFSQDFLSKEWGRYVYFGVFEVKCYKKGTIHVKFQNEKDWELINRKVAEIKGYPLPENISKKK